jgi:hypothetical protein
MVDVCFAGITGWTAPAIVAAIDEADDLTLSSGVFRSAAGQSLAVAAGSISHGAVYATVSEALESAEADVLVDYTSAAAVKNSATRGERRQRQPGGGTSSCPARLAPVGYTLTGVTARSHGLAATRPVTSQPDCGQPEGRQVRLGVRIVLRARRGPLPGITCCCASLFIDTRRHSFWTGPEPKFPGRWPQVPRCSLDGAVCGVSVGSTRVALQERVMIVIIGLIILVAAVVVGVAGVLGNAGSGHALNQGFAVFGYHVTGSTGTLFFYGIVVGAVAILGLSLLLAGARRTSRRGSAARRGLQRSRGETAAVTKERDDLIDQRETARADRERGEGLPPQ